MPPASISAVETVISPQTGWFDWRLAQLWRYRDLITLFVWRDFVAVYKQTILGPAWHVIQPLLTTVVFTIVFGQVAKLSTEGAPPFLFYMIGNVGWTYFASSLDNTSKTFVANQQLLGKVYFHRLVIPISIVFSGLITLGIQLAIFLIVLGWHVFSGAPVHVTNWIWSVPLLVLMLGGFGLSGGVLICALTTRYRDFKHLVTFGVQLMMYVTPVIYPVSAVPARYRWIAELNPLTPVVEALRLAFLGVGTASPERLLVSFGVMVVMIAAAITLFTRVERSFMDTV